MTSLLRDDLIACLVESGDCDRATGQQAYMKSELPFHGVRVPEVRRIASAAAKAHPFGDRAEWEDGVLDIWRRATHREQQYAATEIAHHPSYRKWLDGGALLMIEEMIVTGACAIHCRYCFRRNYPYSSHSVSRRDFQAAIDALASDPTIEEVILSGGDPLTDRKSVV